MARKAVLKVTKGPAEGKIFAVEDEFVIGRSEDAEINTEDVSTSRRHAQLKVEKDGIRIADLDSANGLFVNERRVKSHYLHPGDQVVMGDTTFVFEQEVDPAARRRNFYIILLVIVLVGGGALYYVIEQQRAEAAARAPIYRELTERMDRTADFGFSILYPDTVSVSTRDYIKRPWEGTTRLWGKEPPMLGNQLVTEKVALDDYYFVQFFEPVNIDTFTFVRFEVEVYDGLAAWQGLNDVSLTDEVLAKSVSEAKFKEANVVRELDPDLGYFEMGVTEFPAGVDDAGNPVTFAIEQRCYVVGKRRYLLSAICNRKDYPRRVQDLFDAWFNSFEAKEDTYRSRPREELLTEGKRQIDAADAYFANKLPQRQFMAFHTYADAARTLKQIDVNTAEHRNALRMANTVKRSLQEDLVKMRDKIRESLNRNKFLEANQLIQDMLAIIDDNNPESKVDENSEWRKWLEAAKADAVRIENVTKRSQFQ